MTFRLAAPAQGRPSRLARVITRSSVGSVLLFAVLAVAVGGAVVAHAQGQRIRSGIELVSLNVTVTDPSGKYATDLTEPDFEVYEDGAKQNLTFFSRTQQPIALSLLLDTSASMDERMGIAQEAAIGFARQLHKDDQAEVIDFDSQVRILQAFTNDSAALEKAIRQTTPNGSTSLYNALYIALKDLKKVKAETTTDIRRQAIVLLSDGDDTSSSRRWDETVRLLRASDVVVYPMGFLSNRGSARFGLQSKLLEIARLTGGRAAFPGTMKDLDPMYESIAGEIQGQYLLGYVPTNAARDGKWRKVEIKLKRSPSERTQIRTREGYFAPVK